MSCWLAWRHELLSSTCRFTHTVRIETSSTTELKTTSTQTAMLRRLLRPVFASGVFASGDFVGAASAGVGPLTWSSPFSRLGEIYRAILASSVHGDITP